MDRVSRSSMSAVDELNSVAVYRERCEQRRNTMKPWKVGILVGAAAICMCALLVGCQTQTYAPESKTQTVSASALGKDATLRVGVNASSVPLAGQTSSSSRIVGIDVDVAADLADQLGLKVEIVDVGSDPASALEEGKVDLVLGIDASTGSDEKYWLSPPYIDTGVALFGSSNENSVPTIDSKPKIAAQASSKSSWRVTNLFGNDALVTADDLKGAFEAISNGKARYAAADAVIGSYVAHSNEYPVKIVALLQDPSGYCAAVAESNSELQAAIEAAMKSLVDGGVVDIIERKWLGESVHLDGITVVKSNTAASSNASGSAASAEASGEAAGTEASGESASTEASGESASTETSGEAAGTEASGEAAAA